MTDQDDNALHDAPVEFLQSAHEVTGYCEAQSILPTAEGYVCHCTCGTWDVIASTQEQGVELARQHTADVRAAEARATP